MITWFRRTRGCWTAAFIFILGGATVARSQIASFSELKDLGLVYTNDRQPRVPWSVHIVKIDRARPELTLMASKARGRVIGLERLSAQMSAVPPELVPTPNPKQTKKVFTFFI
jgi:hypothetical protein